MPKLDGFEVLELVGRDVAVVFVTAYDQYALRAFEVHAVDYLLKPFSAERLGEALARARERLRRGERPAPPRRLAARQAAARATRARVLVRDGSRVHVMPVEKIDYVQAQDDYVCFRCEGKDYLKEQTLGAGRRRRSTRPSSSGSTDRICSTWIGWRGSSWTSGKTASRC